MKDSPGKTQKQQNKESWESSILGIKITIVIITGVIGAVFVGLFMSASNSMKKSQSAKPTELKSTSYQAKVMSYDPIDPATLRVRVKVKNIGQSDGKPNCSVNASNPSGSYKGWDVFELDKPITPGSEDYFNGQLVITNEGAAFVDSVTVSCK